ncbi:nucleotide sugar dehydrogenase [Arthrobacter sp. TB 23]|uniref:nucleotide sugar dehydrogenase n=1 Tax=Arthrobacter sp. TB 23 TaxID=494419 RepID=UPI00037F7352|nr:nucleotide sugar dehydrogenase [Arthrobacter sp. TB 23]
MKHLVIIGQGYVGLPLAQGAVSAGLKVTGLDLNRRTVEDLNQGISHVDDISNSEVELMISSGYSATSDSAIISTADVVVMCVPTPLGDAGSPDLGAVEGATRSISEHMTTGTLVVLESTTYPGTTDDLVLPILEQSGLTLDIDFYLAFSPERIDPGNQTYGLTNTPKVVGGTTENSTKIACEFYSSFIDIVVPVKGTKEAETAKLLENTYRHINIALVNEMAKFCHELDIDLWNVIDAAKTKPFGFQAFYPGPGVGGHCIPIDPNYLSYQVRKSLGYPFRFVELAEEINNSMPRYVVQRIQELLNRHGRSLNQSKILLLGVTYKPDIADRRESPAEPIALLLSRNGAVISYHDPKISTWSYDGTTIGVEEDLDSAVDGADVVVLLQNHSEYNVDLLSTTARIFFDTRGATTTASAHRL